MPPSRLALFSLTIFSLLGFSFPARLHQPYWSYASHQQSDSRIVRVAPAHGVAGGSIGVPIELISQGNENAVSFTLTYTPGLLTNPQIELGSGATGGLLTVNPNQAAQGRIGIVMSLPAGQQFSVGAHQIIVIVFRIPANAAAGITPVGFGDQPVRREIVDASARSLTADFSAGQVFITPEGYEADVSPRPNGNNDGNVTLSDFVQVGRFVAGLDTPDLGGEFQRADCAPLNTLGDGRLTVTDWAQAGRYVAGLDVTQRADGPVEPVATAQRSETGTANSQSMPAAMQSSHIHLVIDDPAEDYMTNSSGNSQRSAAVVLRARGDERAFGFSISFNPTHWRFVSATAGKDLAEATLLINAKQAAQGCVGLVMTIPGAREFDDGLRKLVHLRFAALANSPPLTINFGDLPVAREVANIEARIIPAHFTIINGVLARANEETR